MQIFILYLNADTGKKANSASRGQRYTITREREKHIGGVVTDVRLTRLNDGDETTDLSDEINDWIICKCYLYESRKRKKK